MGGPGVWGASKTCVWAGDGVSPVKQTVQSGRGWQEDNQAGWQGRRGWGWQGGWLGLVGTEVGVGVEGAVWQEGIEQGRISRN
jgi:hypothetical protein